MKLLSVMFVATLPYIMCTDRYILENCSLHSPDNNLIIDFSKSLENEDWITEKDWNITYYFSLCRQPWNKCLEKSFFCLELKNGTILDLGSVYVGTTEQKMDGSDDVAFNMTLKGKYGSGSVIIRADQSVADPIVSEIKKNTTDGQPFYDYTVIWNSLNNRPIRSYTTQNSCTLYAGSRSYDLRALPSSRVAMTDRTYIINFCSIDDKCSSYVCETQHGKTRVISDTFELRLLEHQAISFKFITHSEDKIIVNLNCSSNNEELKLISSNRGDLEFFMNTPYVCEPPKMDCLIHLQDSIAYDLSPLQKIIDNYELNFNDGRRLLLNFCGPLNYNQYVFCADGNRYIGCLIDKDNKTESVAIFNNFTFLEPGKLSIIYRGTEKNGLFLNISLKCSKHNSIYPVISAKHSDNSYDITWDTYTACPLKYAAGQNCVIENLYKKKKMNLMPLYNNKHDYNIANGKELFRINVCGKLTRSCSKNPDAAVCYTNSNGKEIAIGVTGAFEPTFVDGQFMFHLQGEPCHKNVTKSRITIIMACEFSNSSTSFPELFPTTKEDECQFYFYWRTHLICGSSASSNCVYSNNSVIYDLSSLRNLRDNYVIKYKDSIIEMNVCHSLIPGHRTHCHEFAGACLTNNSIPSIISFVHDNIENNENLGLINKESEFEVTDNKLRLYYKNGGVCMSSNQSTYSTSIDFVCNNTAIDTEPKLVSAVDCNFNFIWTTSAACPIYKKKTVCTTVDQITKKRFDLSSLMGNDVTVAGSNIILGICQAVGLHGCPENSGACVMKNNSYENIGTYTSVLHYNHSLFLLYEAPNCKSTKIEFSCNGTKEFIQPFLIKQNNCSTFISWPTNLACQNNNDILKCCQGIEDLCENFVQTYEVGINKNEKVFINVCKPLVPQRGLLCPPGSVSCIANNQSSEAFMEEKSLGSVMLRPKILNDSAVILNYFNGSICHKESQTRYSTSIIFVCDRNANVSYPELINISGDCQFEFKWATSLMCNEKCAILEEHEDLNVLSQFQDWDKRILLKNGQRSPYILNLCKVSQKCGTHICKRTNDTIWHQFASMNITRSFRVTDSETELFYTFLKNKTEKDTCGAEVDLVCDITDSGPGKPYLEEERDCFIHVIWKSNLACFTKSEKSSNVAVWVIFSLAMLLFIAVIGFLLIFNRRINLRVFLNRTFGYRRMPGSYTSTSELGSI